MIENQNTIVITFVQNNDRLAATVFTDRTYIGDNHTDLAGSAFIDAVADALSFRDDDIVDHWRGQANVLVHRARTAAVAALDKTTEDLAGQLQRRKLAES